jgi:hypothetical protein
MPESQSTRSLSVYVPPHWQVDPARQGPIGVLCGDALWTFPNEDPRSSGGLLRVQVPYPAGELVNSVWGLAEAAVRLQLSAIWLVPVAGSAPSGRDPRVLREWNRAPWARKPAPESTSFVWHELTARGGLGGSAELAGLVAQAKGPDGKGHGEPIRIIAAWVQDGWRLAGVLRDYAGDPGDRALVVASGILLGSYALGAQFRFSPSHSGTQMIRQELDRWQRRGVELGIPETDRRRLDELRATPIEWARPTGATPPAGLWETPDVALWKYDRNGSYVSSAREVPVGAPVHTDRAQPLNDLRPALPVGVYRIDAAPPDWFDPQLMPGPFHRSGRWVGGGFDLWAWEPQLRLARRWGWEIEIREGWYWPKGQIHDLLRSWQDRLWNARSICNDFFRIGEAAEEHMGRGAEVRQAARVAGGLVKHVGVTSIGRLVPTTGRAVVTEAEAIAKTLPVLWHFTDDRGRETGMVEVEMEPGRVDLIRPDWWSVIISNAVERLLEQCYRYARGSTVLLYVDALYSTSAIAELDGSRDKRGGFKLEAIRQVPRELAFGGDPVKLVRGFAHGAEAGDAS